MGEHATGQDEHSPLDHGVRRPLSPDPTLLDEAHAGLQRLGVTTATSWEVVSRTERPQSTLFALAVRSAQGTVRAYYKQEFVNQAHRDETGRQRQASRRQRALRVEERVHDELASRLADEGAVLAAPLAIRPRQLAAVRLEVKGHPFGRLAWRAGGSRPRAFASVLEKIGRTLRHIEVVGQDSGEDPRVLAEQVRLRFTEGLRRCDDVLSPEDLTRLELRIDRLMTAVEGAGGPGCLHGDINHTNIRVTRGEVGLLDFGWEPAPPHADVVDLISRLRLQRPQVPRLVTWATESLLSGYGLEEAQVAPGMHLARLQWVLRGLRSSVPRVKRLALADLKSLDDADHRSA